MFDQSVEEMSVEDTLDAVETWTAEQTQRQISVFVAAAHFADLHSPATVRVRRDGDGRVLPGTEQATQLGGAGTPAVGEFAAALFGARIGRTSYGARMLIADALDARHRLPKLWTRMVAGEVPVGYARHVAAATRALSVAAAGWIDGEVAAYADGRLCWSRFEAMVAGKVVDVDPDAAAEKEREAAARRFAKVSQASEHGQKSLYVRTATAEMVRIDATIAYLADALRALGDTDDADTRRAKAVLVMANPTQALQLLAAFARHRRSTPTPQNTPEPVADEDELPFPDAPDGEGGESANKASGQFLEPFRPGDGCETAAGLGITPHQGWPLGFNPRDLLPKVTLYLHLATHPADATGPGSTSGVVRWEGEGPVSRNYLLDVLGPGCHFTITPVLDPVGLAPVDAYEIPDRHRDAVHVRTPADVFPYASATTSRDGRTGRQLDHNTPYQPPQRGGPPGQTRPGNLAPLTGYHHRVKTHGGWLLKQPFDGIFVWRDLTDAPTWSTTPAPADSAPAPPAATPTPKHQISPSRFIRDPMT